MLKCKICNSVEEAQSLLKNGTYYVVEDDYTVDIDSVGETIWQSSLVEEESLRELSFDLIKYYIKQNKS